MSLRVLFFMLILLSQMVLGEVVASKPDHIKSDAWNKVEPYLLPEDHTLKPLLDAIFSKSRANLSLKTMKKAGFVEAHPRRWTHLIVTTHPDVPGYVFKIYLDAQRYYNGIKEYEQWLKRIKGVHLIRDEIERRGWQDTFKTPKKWIYILPAEPSPPKEFIRKDFILVEEDMNIFDHKKNLEIWKSDWVTEEKLYQFYALCEELGLHDCTKPDNAPFSVDGKIAFVDTQTVYYWPVLYDKMTPYLDSDMKQFWKSITKDAR